MRTYNIEHLLIEKAKHFHGKDDASGVLSSTSEYHNRAIEICNNMQSV